eukprot:TRINITY_DN3572_c0_g1_i1.p1 TRINITY_DN3572_c0_g1~~TRINITY_DN3572_c0_g1_i1.p1  ORF type:complete len:1422 (+),score=450.65 TRINITY_DN3572_c0_g1_i1:77-4267(+)
MGEVPGRPGRAQREPNDEPAAAELDSAQRCLRGRAHSANSERRGDSAGRARAAPPSLSVGRVDTPELGSARVPRRSNLDASDLADSIVSETTSSTRARAQQRGPQRESSCRRRAQRDDGRRRAQGSFDESDPLCQEGSFTSQQTTRSGRLRVPPNGLAATLPSGRTRSPLFTADRGAVTPTSPPRQRGGRPQRDKRDSDSVLVAVRVRSFIPRELRREGGGECVVNFKKSTCMIKAKDHRPPTFTFTFDHCIWSHARSAAPGSPAEEDPPMVNQAALYEKLGRGLLDNAWRGFNSSLLAYGQTGSGKTYSIFGPPEVPMDELLASSSCHKLHPEAGLVPRAFADLFARLEENEPENFIVEVAMMEIYMERVFDLLARRAHRDVRGTNELGFVVEKLTKRRVTNWNDVAEFLKEGNAQKSVAATALNQTSSRAHTLIEVYLRKLLPDGQGPSYSAKVTIVDLAGSENVKLSEVVGEQSRQASIINLSLMELGKVVEAVVARGDQPSGKQQAQDAGAGDACSMERRDSGGSVLTPSAQAATPPTHALRQKGPHISFRGSVLTKLLKECLGGNSMSTILVTISPSPWDVPQTVSALRFADRAKHLRNHAKFNEDAFCDAGRLAAIVEEEHRRQGKLFRLERDHFQLLGRQALNEQKAAELRRRRKRLQEQLSAAGEDWAEADSIRQQLRELDDELHQANTTAAALGRGLERVQSQLEKHGAVMRQLTGLLHHDSGAGAHFESPQSSDCRAEAALQRERYEREVQQLRQQLQDARDEAHAAAARARQAAHEEAQEERDRLLYQIEQLRIEAQAKKTQYERERAAQQEREESLWCRLEAMQRQGGSGTGQLSLEVERLRRKIEDDAAMHTCRMEHEAGLREQDARRHAAERERWRRDKRRLQQEADRERGEWQRLSDEREHLLERLARLEEVERRQWEQKCEWRNRCEELVRELYAQERQHEDEQSALEQRLERLKAIARRSAQRWRRLFRDAQAEAEQPPEAAQEDAAEQVARMVRTASAELRGKWLAMLSQHAGSEEELQRESERTLDRGPASGSPHSGARARREALLSEVSSALADFDSGGSPARGGTESSGSSEGGGRGRSRSPTFWCRSPEPRCPQPARALVAPDTVPAGEEPVSPLEGCTHGGSPTGAELPSAAESGCGSVSDAPAVSAVGREREHSSNASPWAVPAPASMPPPFVGESAERGARASGSSCGTPRRPSRTSSPSPSLGASFPSCVPADPSPAGCTPVRRSSHAGDSCGGGPFADTEPQPVRHRQRRQPGDEDPCISALYAFADADPPTHSGGSSRTRRSPGRCGSTLQRRTPPSAGASAPAAWGGGAAQSETRGGQDQPSSRSPSSTPLATPALPPADCRSASTAASAAERWRRRQQRPSGAAGC